MHVPPSIVRQSELAAVIAAAGYREVIIYSCN